MQASYLELKLKSSFLRMIFGNIFIKHVQPFEAANNSAAFFLCRPMMKHTCHTFFNKLFVCILICEIGAV